MILHVKHLGKILFQNGLFSEEVVPVSVKPKRGAPFVVCEDEEYRKLVESKVEKACCVFRCSWSETLMTIQNADVL